MLMIETERLLLRNFQMEDKDDCFVFLSDEQTCLDDGGYHAFSYQDEAYMKLMEKFQSEKQRFMIVEKKSKRVIGTIHVMDSELGADIKTIGYVIAPKYRRKGYAYEAVRTVIEYYFEHAGVKKFLASCFIYNQSSKCLLEKLGFIFNGVIELGIEHEELGTLNLYSYYLESKVREE